MSASHTVVQRDLDIEAAQIRANYGTTLRQRERLMARAGVYRFEEAVTIVARSRCERRHWSLLLEQA